MRLRLPVLSLLWPIIALSGICNELPDAIEFIFVRLKLTVRRCATFFGERCAFSDPRRKVPSSSSVELFFFVFPAAFDSVEFARNTLEKNLPPRTALSCEFGDDDSCCCCCCCCDDDATVSFDRLLFRLRKKLLYWRSQSFLGGVPGDRRPNCSILLNDDVISSSSSTDRMEGSTGDCDFFCKPSDTLRFRNRRLDCVAPEADVVVDAATARCMLIDEVQSSSFNVGDLDK